MYEREIDWDTVSRAVAVLMGRAELPARASEAGVALQAAAFTVDEPPPLVREDALRTLSDLKTAFRWD